jgi:hypothetical protein
MTQEQYYTNGGVTPTDKNWGSYQYLSLADVVNNFLLMYSDDGLLINGVNRYMVLFHAKRALQELNYDGNREVKTLELDLSDSLNLPLPPDYVNYVRISMFQNGVLYTLSENTQAISAVEFLQDDLYNILFDDQGNALIGTSKLDKARVDGIPQQLNPFNNELGWYIDGLWYFGFRYGGKFGLNTETANNNPTFRINKSAGVINFSSGAAHGSILVEYISDGMYALDEDSMQVNKLAETYMYAYIKWAILNTKANQPEYIVQRARKEKVSEWRNLKIRLSNLHAGRLLMNMRGQDKWLK